MYILLIYNIYIHSYYQLLIVWYTISVVWECLCSHGVDYIASVWQPFLISHSIIFPFPIPSHSLTVLLPLVHFPFPSLPVQFLPYYISYSIILYILLPYPTLLYLTFHIPFLHITPRHIISFRSFFTLSSLILYSLYLHLSPFPLYLFRRFNLSTNTYLSIIFTFQIYINTYASIVLSYHIKCIYISFYLLLPFIYSLLQTSTEKFPLCYVIFYLLLSSIEY